MSKPKIFLADLTHTGQVIAANVFPLPIGLIASYLLKGTDHDVEVQLFKYPSDLNEALKREKPDLVGFSNYSWNCEIAYAFARRIKESSPRTVVVCGGPNYGLTEEEVNEFWRRYPLIDFYIVKEGEKAFLELYKSLVAHYFDSEAVKALSDPLPNTHFLRDGKVVQGPIIPRIQNLNELASPYLDGLMDKFFDGILIPMIYSTRGCPFRCTFCSEGNSYYNKVYQRRDLEEELEYIAQRRKNIRELLITDANFGMFQEDREKAEVIARIQKKYDWPKRVLVSTGKNKKEKVIEVAEILDGALQIAASLQSTDEEILKRIKRDNISQDALKIIVEKSHQADSQTYTEIILGLPGDTFEKHRKSLKDVCDSGLGIIRMYQLIMLPQTEVNEPDSRRENEMKTRYRINPRSFGRYPMLGQDIVVSEYEEICVETGTLSFSDYLACRELDLTVEILHNTGMFVELMGLCRWLNQSWFDLLYKFFEKRRTFNKEITELYDLFTAASQERLWATREALINDVSQNIDRYLDDPNGTNEMATSKALAFFHLHDTLHKALFQLMEEQLKKEGKYNQLMEIYLEELMRFSQMRKRDLLNISETQKAHFHFDFLNISRAQFEVNPASFFKEETHELIFSHSDNQKEMIKTYVGQYGTTIDGLGRILMRAPMKLFFRSLEKNRAYFSGHAMELFG